MPGCPLLSHLPHMVKCSHGVERVRLCHKCNEEAATRLKEIEKLGEYYGTLETYFETGMECLGFILHDNRGLHRAPSFDNETKDYTGPEQEYHSLEWTIFFDKTPQYIEVYEDDGSVLYKGSLTLDRAKMRETGYRYSFIPKEVPLQAWFGWFSQKRVKPLTAKLTKKPAPAF